MIRKRKVRVGKSIKCTIRGRQKRVTLACCSEECGEDSNPVTSLPSPADV